MAAAFPLPPVLWDGWNGPFGSLLPSFAGGVGPWGSCCWLWLCSWPFSWCLGRGGVGVSVGRSVWRLLFGHVCVVFFGAVLGLGWGFVVLMWGFPGPSGLSGLSGLCRWPVGGGRVCAFFVRIGSLLFRGALAPWLAHCARFLSRLVWRMP